MGHCERLVTMRMRRNYRLCVPCFIGLLITFATLTYQDQVGEPKSGLLCISDCATCPVICSPPPPVLESHPPPSQPVHHSPPPSYYSYSPPPPPKQTPSPSPSPPSPLKETPPSPPSSYPSWGSTPPPFKYYFNVPPTGPVLVPPGSGTTSGPHDYSYPYYYYYTSKASSPLSAHHASYFFILFLFHFVFSCW